MPLDTPTTRRRLRESDLSGLFIEDLGWDHPGPSLDVSVDGQVYGLRAIAQKRGVQVFQCMPGADGEIPERNIRQKLDKEVTKAAREHLIVFLDEAHKRQVWQWVAREPGKPTALREHVYVAGQAADALIQKLDHLRIPISEEDGITITGVAFKLKDAFDKDGVTKRFYDRFKTEHEAFLAFITGIREVADREWYASLMLNRLMFIYFIQKKGSLDGDADYLKNRLGRVQVQRGTGSFLSFYRYFLKRLFHEGLSAPEAERSAELDTLLGRVPYLNGGLFDVHQLEDQNPEIDIPDEAFDKLFAFFDAYHWHLDDRPLREGNEINPDVLGYIFEKYINQKQMGAYYSKEDITEYISKNTIVPFLLDSAAKDFAIAFRPGDGSIWRLLQLEPDRYIHSSVLQGVDETLPAEVAAGIIDLSKRDYWNRAAPQPFALPTETWREHVGRRERCLELRTKLSAGEIVAVNDLVTLNLDMRQFLQDAIERCEGPELLRALFKAIENIAVVDPACGSGAFLFAALNILQPLYEACLERMEAFLADLDQLEPGHDARRFADFRRILDNVAKHPNRQYFILKSIILNNLYGVDIMEEAVEICKLRLFLKLVAELETYEEIEPLPDIDFNVRAGNTLVGYATYEDALRAFKLDLDDLLPRVREAAEDAAKAFEHFHEMQTEHRMDSGDFREAKASVRNRLKSLGLELDRRLAGQYGIDPNSARDFNRWQANHQPFHWFVEFFAIMARGGFDVAIANPPYVEYDDRIKSQYTVQGFVTLNCGNLHAFFAEKAQALTRAQGRIGFIVPLPSINTARMLPLQKLIKPKSDTPSRELHISAYDERPSKLFTGVDQRLIIEIFGPISENAQLHTTGINRWHSAARPHLFDSLHFAGHPKDIVELAPSVLNLKKTPLEADLLRLVYKNSSVQRFRATTKTSELVAYRTAGGRYWKVVLDRPFEGESLSNKVSYLRGLSGRQAVALFSSSTFWWYYSSHFDMYNLKDYMLFGFRFSNPSPRISQELEELGLKLVDDLQRNAVTETIQHRTRGQVSSPQYVASKSKFIIDEIDRVLAEHYGFPAEGLDFIVNYDIKYRLGAGGGHDAT